MTSPTVAASQRALGGVSITHDVTSPLADARRVSHTLLSSIQQRGILDAVPGDDLILDDIRVLARARDLVKTLTTVRDWCSANLHEFMLAPPVDALTIIQHLNFACDLARHHVLARQVNPWQARSYVAELNATLDQLIATFGKLELVDVALLSAVQAPTSSDDVESAREQQAAAAATYVGGRIAAAAVCVLPTEYQARYDEEFRAELYALAQDGMPRWRQLLHSFRLFDRAFQLRAELHTAIQQRRNT